MSRLPKKEIEERESFMKNLFRAEPELSQPKANDKFFEAFKSRMRPQRVYTLRKIVQEEMLAKGPSTPAAAGRNPQKEKPMTNKKTGKNGRKKAKATAKKPITTSKVANRNPDGAAPEPVKDRLTLVSVDVGNEGAIEQAIVALRNKGLFRGGVDSKGAGYVVVRSTNA